MTASSAISNFTSASPTHPPTHLARLSDFVHNHQHVVQLVDSCSRFAQPLSAIERGHHEQDARRVDLLSSTLGRCCCGLLLFLLLFLLLWWCLFGCCCYWCKTCVAVAAAAVVLFHLGAVITIGASLCCCFVGKCCCVTDVSGFCVAVAVVVADDAVDVVIFSLRALSFFTTRYTNELIGSTVLYVGAVYIYGSVEIYAIT